MNVRELVVRVKQEAPDELSTVLDGQAVALLRDIFRQITGEVDATPEGVITIAGLGSFHIRVAHQEKDG